MKRILLCTALAVTLLAMTTSPVMAQTLIDGIGQALLPPAAGDSLKLFATIGQSTALTPPLPLDFENFQYTLVVKGLVLEVDGDPQLYRDGFVFVYEDAGSPANYDDRASFTDGEVILSGVLRSLERDVLLPGFATLLGTLDWRSGTRLGELEQVERWRMLGATNANSAEDGFDEAWDWKLEPPDIDAPIEDETWGGVKSFFGN